MKNLHTIRVGQSIIQYPKDLPFTLDAINNQEQNIIRARFQAELLEATIQYGNWRKNLTLNLGNKHMEQEIKSNPWSTLVDETAHCEYNSITDHYTIRSTNKCMTARILIHELAHFICQHGKQKTWKPIVQKNNLEYYSYHIGEVEADLISQLAMQLLDKQHELSFEYILDWIKELNLEDLDNLRKHLQLRKHFLRGQILHLAKAININRTKIPTARVKNITIEQLDYLFNYIIEYREAHVQNDLMDEEQYWIALEAQILDLQTSSPQIDNPDDEALYQCIECGTIHFESELNTTDLSTVTLVECPACTGDVTLINGQPSQELTNQ